MYVKRISFIRSLEILSVIYVPYREYRSVNTPEELRSIVVLNFVFKQVSHLETKMC